MEDRPYVFLGVGGIGMSALAFILLEQGLTVLGVDKNRSKITRELTKKGAFITTSDELELPGDSILVASSAIKSSHPLMVQAKKKNRPILHRSELLARLVKGSTVLAVAGTHGKTSTSSLLAFLLEELGQNPSYALGGGFNDGRAHGKRGKGSFFVVEADESDGSFLNYPVDGAIVTNVELDHIDYWKAEEKLKEGFTSFYKGVSSKAPFVYCCDDLGCAALFQEGITYGKSDTAQVKLTSCQDCEGGQLFSFFCNGKTYNDFFLPLMGDHQVLNALSCIAMLSHIGFDPLMIKEKLRLYKGVNKRMQLLGVKNGVRFFSDYAHHPTETRKTLMALKSHYQESKVTCLFQPHRYSRMPLFVEEGARAFSGADRCLIFDVFAAGEEPEKGLEQALVSSIKSAGSKETMYVKDIEQFKKAGLTFSPGEVVVLMGAGSIHDWAEKVVEQV
jgi:UDP-N-acetylmuramate--alanine ligase